MLKGHWKCSRNRAGWTRWTRLPLRPGSLSLGVTCWLLPFPLRPGSSWHCRELSQELTVIGKTRRKPLSPPHSHTHAFHSESSQNLKRLLCLCLHIQEAERPSPYVFPCTSTHVSGCRIKSCYDTTFGKWQLARWPRSNLHGSIFKGYSYFRDLYFVFFLIKNFFFIFKQHPAARGTLVPWPGIKPMPPALGGRVLTTGLCDSPCIRISISKWKL